MITISEFSLIEKIKRHFPINKPETLGIGDDCAIIERKDSLLISTDTMIDGIHFLSKKMSFFAIGYKSLAVNISDIAAMCGKPEYFLLTLGIPDYLCDNDIEEFIKGLKKISEEYNISLIGGDTVFSKKFLISITILGTPFSKPVLRNGAKIGDFIYVTGKIGDSFIGLMLLLGNNFPVKEKEYFLKRHFYPLPRIEWMRKIDEKYRINSAIDISDGLLGDLIHIAEESRCGFDLYIDNIPFSKEKMDKKFFERELFYIKKFISGGEDYEIIFTSPDEIDTEKLKGEGIFISKIGKITSEEKRIFYRNRKLDFDSFKKKSFTHF